MVRGFGHLQSLEVRLEIGGHDIKEDRREEEEII
jgi:hypothetical protein